MLMIQESYVNQDRGWRFWDSEWHETSAQDRGKLFLSLQREFGRCAGKMYIDLVGGGAREIGWVFEKKMQYEDAHTRGSENFYIREVWVQVRESS